MIRGLRDGKNDRFIPVLTVMVDYGNAPFLWLSDDPAEEEGIGANLCDGSCWDASLPMSEGLWRKFSHWAIEFDRTAFYADDFNADDWDWLAFHARGLQLSRWLKDEVGETYRVVYLKPYEDPNDLIDERIELLAHGAFMSLPSFRSPSSRPLRFCDRIVSGGQTGADRAALDFAIKHRYAHGGWAPHGRQAEDGPIALKYQLVEVIDGDGLQRTRRNVEDSDGTLIINIGALEGGSLATHAFARQQGKPLLVLQLEAGVCADAVESVQQWLRGHAIKILNVAGPRESERAGIYRMTYKLLELIDDTLRPRSGR